MQTIWLSPTNFVTGDPTLRVSYPFVSHPSTVVSCTAPGDFKWVSMSLRLPPDAQIEEVIICYEVSNARSFISQVRLAEMTTPDHATVIHDDPTDLTSTTPTTYSSAVPGLVPSGALTLELRLNFQDASDEILLGAVGVNIQAPTGRCVNSIADFKALSAGAFRCVQLLGYYAPGDGGGGEFYWDGSSTEADNGGTIIVPASNPTTGRWKRLVEGPLSVKWFGAKGTEAAPNDTHAIKAAIATLPATGGTIYFPAGVYKIIDTIDLSSGTTVIIDSGAVIQSSTVDISLLKAANQTGIVVRGPGKIKQTAAGKAAYVGGVDLENCTNCHVEGVAFEGMQWAGVLLRNSSKCSVRFSYFANWLGTVQDSADVCIYEASNENVVEANWLYGGGEHGVLVQDPYEGLLPSRNIVANNRIGQHTAYGVVVYMPGFIPTLQRQPTLVIQPRSAGTGNTWNRVSGNYIENIQGSCLTNRSSGSGVYIVGNWAGGTAVTDNTIKNCCVQTLDRSLAPAGIGVNGIPAGISAVVVAGNCVTDMPAFDGILVVSSAGGCVIDANSVTMPPGNANGSGIRIENANGCVVSGNRVAMLSPQSGILLYADTVAIDGVTVDGNIVTHVQGNGIVTIQVGGVTINGAVIADNRTKTTDNAPNGLQLTSLVDSSVTGNVSSVGSQAALAVNGCTGTRIANNVLTTTGTNAVSFTDTCTNSYYDKTNRHNASPTNSSAGLIVEMLGSSAPASNSWAVGDRVEQSVPIVGNPKGWRCTVAGTPGTWVSEGNL